MKHKFRIHECSWPDCGCKTDGEEFWMDAGWMSFAGGDPSEGWVEGMPEDGYLCLHHKEAIDALEEGDVERFMTLASI
jgi:hypothetical protein